MAIRTVGTPTALGTTIESAEITDGTIVTADLANDSVGNAALGPYQTKTLRFKYDVTAQGGTNGQTYTLTDASGAAQTVPSGVLITQYNIITTENGAGGGSISIGANDGSTNDADGIHQATPATNFVVGIGFGNFPYSSNDGTKAFGATAGATTIYAAITNADVTDGTILVDLDYREV